MFSEASDVHLVNHCPREPQAQRFITLPMVRGYVGNHTLHGGGAVVARFARGGTAVVRRLCNRPAIGIQQHLLEIETKPMLRSEGPLYSVAVNLSCPDPWHEDVPIMMTAIP